MLTRLRAVLSDELNRASHELDQLMQKEPAPLSSRATGRPQAAAKRLQKRVSLLGQLVGGLSTIDEDMLWHDRAGFGSHVTAKDLASNATETYTLMAGHLIDLDEGQVSMASPLGQAFVGSKAGKKVTVTTPVGTRQYEIVAVSTLPEQFDVFPAPRPPRRKSDPKLERLPAA